MLLTLRKLWNSEKKSKNPVKNLTNKYLCKQKKILVGNIFHLFGDLRSMKIHKNTKILITGGNGVLAKYVARQFSDALVLAPTKRELYITNAKQLKAFFTKNRPQLVFHLAAKTNVDQCELHPEDAISVNAVATKKIAGLCQQFQSLLVYTSTAAVFDGTQQSYGE